MDWLMLCARDYYRARSSLVVQRCLPTPRATACMLKHYATRQCAGDGHLPAEWAGRRGGGGAAVIELRSRGLQLVTSFGDGALLGRPFPPCPAANDVVALTLDSNNRLSGRNVD